MMKLKTKKYILIGIFALSVLLNIIFMMDSNRKKEELLYSLRWELRNISVLLNSIAVQFESEKNVVCSDYNVHELETCCRIFDIEMGELCSGVTLKDYNQPVSFLRLYDFEFMEMIMSKDIDSLRGYVTEIDELLEELPNSEGDYLSWYDNIAKSLDWSRTRNAIINEFKIFSEKVKVYSEGKE